MSALWPRRILLMKSTSSLKQPTPKSIGFFDQRTRSARADRASAPVGMRVLGSVLVDVTVEDLGDLTDFGEESGEFGGEDGLHAVGEGFFGLVMDFDE